MSNRAPPDRQEATPDMVDLISTKQAKKILGVGSTTIKRWADRNLLRGFRTPSGKRKFDRTDVERLSRQQEWAAGNPASIENWARMLTDASDVAVLAEQIGVLRDELDSWMEVADFLGAVAEFIGDRWASGDCSVVEEHIATNLLRRALDNVADSFETADDAPVCALATLSGEQHGIGLSLTQLCLRSEGYRVLWIGVDTPLDDLVATISESRLQLLGLSASRWSTDYGYLARTYRNVAAACESRGTELILGGAGAWPDIIDYGYRCHSFAGLKNILDSLDAD